MHHEAERVHFDGQTTPADPKFDVHNPYSAWTVILQRAVLQAVRDWDPSQSIESPHGGGAADALAILTGQYPEECDVKSRDAPRKVRSALLAHQAVVLGKSGHYWAVLGTNRNELRLYNPYGSHSTLSWRTLLQEGGSFVIAKP
jgi:hypothetical protein